MSLGTSIFQCHTGFSAIFWAAITESWVRPNARIRLRDDRIVFVIPRGEFCLRKYDRRGLTFLFFFFRTLLRR